MKIKKNSKGRDYVYLKLCTYKLRCCLDFNSKFTPLLTEHSLHNYFISINRGIRRKFPRLRPNLEYSRKPNFVFAKTARFCFTFIYL